VPARSTRSRRLVWLAAAFLAAVVLLGFVASLISDWLWFGELGQRGVFWRMLQARLAVRLLLGGIYAAVLFLNLRIAAGSFGSIRRRISNIEIHEAIKPLHLNLIAGLAALGLAYLFTAGVGAQWPRLLLFLHATPFGVADPIFGRDVSFYVFSLPVYQYLQTNLLVLVVLTAVLVGVVYLTSGALEISSQYMVIKDRPRAHLSALAAACFALLAWGYRLDMLELVHSTRGVVHGASYTDVHAQIPGYWVLIGLGLAAAGVALLQSFRGSLRRVGLAALGLFAGSVVFKILVPALVQQFQVEPDEIARESPYIEHNIRLTRRAFGLDAIERRRFPLAEELGVEALERSRGEIQSIRLWDWRPLLQTYGQLQEIRLYYSFADVDLDRYRIADQGRQVMLSVREMQTEDLTANAQTWQNVHLVYTHGYGLVMSPVDEVSSEGLPNFFIRDIPPAIAPRVANGDLEMRRPEIYYGELTEPYALVNTRVREFDFPQGDANVYTSYAGSGGVPLDASWKKLLFAWRFGTAKFLLADAITSRSRLMYHRRIGERVRKIAPFLLYDADPYPVIHDGRIVWIQDAYTATDDYPYSEQVGFRGLAVNYARNSVKAVVDAYDGSVVFYAFDEEDPILASYREIFPGLFRPAAEMPAGLSAHVRYPEDLFTLQTHALQAYHMTDARVFYNKEDYWNLPNEIYQETPQVMDPYYVVLTLPGEREPQFMLVLPFTPSGRDNMIALLAAKSDGADYGELVLYEFPKDELIYGPMQVEARIDQDSRISQQITLWSQKGSTVIRGNLLVIPLEGSILYIEPLFLQAQKSQLPELKQVIGAYGPRIVMSETLDKTLSMLVAGRETGRAPALGVGGEEGTGRGAREGRTVAGAGRLEPATGGAPEEILGEGRRPARPAARALELYRAALAAQRAGDWAAYGERLRELGETLEDLQATE
jgi:uncharacterized membrane protein (UPF0182 family)